MPAACRKHAALNTDSAYCSTSASCLAFAPAAAFLASSDAVARTAASGPAAPSSAALAAASAAACASLAAVDAALTVASMVSAPARAHSSSAVHSVGASGCAPAGLPPSASSAAASASLSAGSVAAEASMSSLSRRCLRSLPLTYDDSSVSLPAPAPRTAAYSSYSTQLRVSTAAWLSRHSTAAPQAVSAALASATRCAGCASTCVHWFRANTSIHTNSLSGGVSGAAAGRPRVNALTSLLKGRFHACMT
mmetsp:Transcript_12317/g.30129  ORF Transcript_12317/g.30129 Transcript_12317/m.30129 type:complete len:250 (-) Transcript_12317:386-1135(-)